MDVFVDTIDSSFSLELGFWDTVLTIKQKIEKSQGIPVSRQVIFFKGKVLQDHFDIIQCEILQNSRLKLFLSPEDNPNQNNEQVPQTEQPSSSSSVSLNPIEEFANMTQTWPLPVGSKIDQVLQTKETQVSLTEVNEFLGIQESLTMVEGKTDQMLHQQTEQHEVEDNLPPVSTVGSSTTSNRNQEGRPLASDKGKENIEIPDSPVKKKLKTGPVKMTVLMKPLKENWIIPVEVNADDNVEELRKELVKMEERGEIYLPKEEYLLIHNQARLIDDKSFQSNHVADGDIIEIIGGFMS